MADAIERDPNWLVGSDLIDDFDFTVDNAYFQYDSQNVELVELVLEGDTSDEDTPRLDAENENALRVRVGRKWIVKNDGAEIEHESGKIKPVNQNSHYGMWVLECLNELGMGPTLQSRGSLREADVWVGLSFHILRKQFTTTIEGEKVVYSKPLPAKFLGEGGAEPAKGKAGKATPKPKAKKQQPAEEPEEAADDTDADGLPDIEPKILAKLKVAAKKSDDYSAFIDAAFDIDGVSNDADLQAWLMDESSFDALKG